MKHIFNIRTQTVQGKICNKKIFNLKVAGLSIMISWPLVPIKTSFKHIAASGTPWIKTNITREPLYVSMKFIADAVKANSRVRIVIDKNDATFKHEVSIVNHIKTRFSNLQSSFLNKATTATSRMKIQLFGSGQAFQNITTIHAGNASCDRFYKLVDWDYFDETERILSEIDDLSLNEMDKIVS